MSRGLNLTKGNVAKSLIVFSVPILLGMVLQQLYSTIDSVIVGHYEGAHALASVGTTFPITFIVIAVASGLANGASVIVGKTYGANEKHKLNRIIKVTLRYSVISSIVVGILLYLCSPLLLNLIQASVEIYSDALIYLRVYSIGLIFTFAYNVMSGVFRSLGDSKSPLIFLGVASIINIILDLIFVAVFNMGVFGVSLATLIAQGISFVLQLIVLNKKQKEFKEYEKDIELDKEFDKKISKELVSLAIPSMISSITTGINIFISQSFVNSFGANASAAFTAGSKVESFAMMPMINMSIAMTAFTAQNMGAEKPERVTIGLKYSLLFCLIVAIISGVIVFISPELLLGLFISNASIEITNMGIMYLNFMLINLVSMVILFPCEGVLRGSGDVRIIAIASAFDTVIKIAVTYTLINVFNMGILAVWIGAAMSWGTHALVIGVRYKMGVWKKIHNK